MSRKTLSPTRRGVAGLTAAVVAAGSLSVALATTSVAAGPVITVTGATVAHPAPTKTTPTLPAAGPFDGSGTAVSIVGTNFPATPTVTFGETPAAAVMRLSDKLIIAKAPKAPEQTVVTADLKVPVTVGDGTGAAEQDLSAPVTKTDAYTYKAAPTLTGAAYSADKKSLEITGTNLDDTTLLQLGPLAVKVKPAQSTATKVTVRIPSALTRASYAITATTYWGEASLDAAWSVLPVPSKIVAATGTATVKSADSLDPATYVRILGKSLGSVSAVSFGSAPATFVVSSDSELFVQVPPMAATQTVTNNVAKVDVVVQNGALKAAKPLKFEYKVAPIVTAVSQGSTAVVGDVTAATGTVVTLTGKNLSGAKLYFGAAKGAKAVSAKAGSSATSAQFVMPTKAANGFVLGTAYDLWVVTKGGNLKTDRRITVTP